MNLIISKELTAILPNFNVTAYQFTLKNKTALNKSENVAELLNNISALFCQKYTINDILMIPPIKETRDGYKMLGKDPSHTRPACEALLRRVLNNKGINLLGDVIDLGNILSLCSNRSVCVVDADKIIGDINIRIGTAADSYMGIGRGLINVENIPIYEDDVMPFGCPTSDNIRTAVDETTINFIVMIINFSNLNIDNDEEMLKNLYTSNLDIKTYSKVNVKYE
jgi:DNA/RNA-binding domain of Phe-tRNA-synthetase-like protein